MIREVDEGSEIVDGMFITDIEELEAIIKRAFWVEHEFETMISWDAYTQIDENKKDILYKLASESERHKIKVKKLIKNLDGLDVKDIRKDMRERNFNLKKSAADSEIFTEVLKGDMLALDLYTKLNSYTTEELINDAWKGERNEYYTILESLIKDEKKHINMLKPHVYIGKIQRIR